MRLFCNGEAQMNFNFRVVNGAAVLVALLLATASVRAVEQQQGAGSFDINKVRELSMNPQTGSPSSVGPRQERKETPNYTFVVLRIIGSLAIIIVLIMLVSWLIRKAGLGGASRIGGGGIMNVVEALPLGQNRNVVLLRVRDAVYLCGQTPSNVTLLDKIEGQRAADILASGKGRSPVVQFKDAFNQFITKVKK
jgi:flagellar biosynthetic protein FliO